MTDIFLAQALILFLHAFVLFRPFSKQVANYHQSKDVLSLLPFVANFLILLSFLAFSVQVSLISLLILNFFACFLNLSRALSFISGMQKDYFSISYKIMSAFLLLFTTILFTILFIYHPQSNSLSNFQTSKTLYYGSHNSGFFEHKGLFNAYSAEKIEIFPQEDTLQANNDPLTIIIIPDYCFDTEDIYETALFLVEKGYKVVLFDFFAYDNASSFGISQKKIIKNFYEKALLFFKPEVYQKEKDTFISQKKKELLSAISILYSEKPEPVYLLAEGLSRDAAFSLQKEYPSVIQAIYSSEQKALFENNQFSGLASFQKTKPLDTQILGIKEGLSSKVYADQADFFIQSLVKSNDSMEEKNDTF